MKFKQILGIILISYGIFGMSSLLYNICQNGQLFKMNLLGVAIIGGILFFVGLSFFKTIKKKGKHFDNFDQHLST